MGARFHVLYVEDSPFDAALTATHFAREARDIRLEVVTSGRECLGRVRTEAFDLVLLDNRLGDVSGVDVLSELRRAGLAVAVVMLTGVGDDETVARALRAGADDYVVKSGAYLNPLPDLIRSLVARIRDRTLMMGDGAVRVRMILNVEPEPGSQRATSDHFARAAPHFQIHTVASHGRALEMISAGHEFDVALVSPRTTDMDAFQFVHETLGRNLKVPLIIVAGQGEEELAAALLRLGASDYIVKRENYLVQLPHAIEHVLHRAHLDRTTRRLHAELQALNASLEERVTSRTTELMREVADRKRAEEEARDLYLRYHSTLENMLEGCQIIGRDFRYVFVNDVAARHGKRAKGDLIGRRMQDCYPGIENTDMFASLKRCMEERITARFESSFGYDDGSSGFFELSMEPVPQGIFVLSIDITEHKRAESALRRSEEKLSVTLQSIGDGVIATDSEGLITLMNGAAETMTGWTFSEAARRRLGDVFRVVHAESREPLVDPVKKVLRSGEVVGLANNTTLLAKGGAEYQIADTAAPIKDSNGRLGGVVLVFRNVTDEYRIQRALRDREKQLTLITNSLPGPVTRTTREGRYLFANAAFERAIGRPLAEIIGRTRLEVLGPEACAELEPHVQRALSGVPVTFESKRATPEGREGRFLVTVLPDRDDAGGVCGVLAMATDISTREALGR